MTSRLGRQRLAETTQAQPSLTWNFRGGPSGWIRALATSATIMPRRRTAGRLLSRRHFTPAIRLASNSGRTSVHMLSVPVEKGAMGQGARSTSSPSRLSRSSASPRCAKQMRTALLT